MISLFANVYTQTNNQMNDSILSFQVMQIDNLSWCVCTKLDHLSVLMDDPLILVYKSGFKLLYKATNIIISVLPPSLKQQQLSCCYLQDNAPTCAVKHSFDKMSAKNDI